MPTVAPATNLTLKVKLNSTNYSLWSRLMKIALGGRGKSAHITGLPQPPLPSYPAYPAWEQQDQLVFTWIIDNIDDSLVNNVSRYSTAKTLWDGLAVTYGSGSDLLQIFDLHKRCYTIKQANRPLEALWDQFQGLWMTIDTLDPNPMESPGDIATYAKKVQEQRLYQLLLAVDERYGDTKREILKRDPRPSVENAYNELRRTEIQTGVLKVTPSDLQSSLGMGQGLAVKGPTTHNKPKGTQPPR